MQEATKQDAYRIINAYAKKLTADPEQVHEVTQEVFLKMHRSLHSLHEPEKLTAWLRRIVYTTLVEHHRNQQKRQALAGADPAAEPDARNGGNEAVMECIALLLKLLPTKERELLEAVELHGISQTRYAADHRLPVSTVKSRVQRAKQKLKAQLTGNCFFTTDAYGDVVDFAPPVRLA